jgi:hypothetical protein
VRNNKAVCTGTEIAGKTQEKADDVMMKKIWQ